MLYLCRAVVFGGCFRTSSPSRDGVKDFKIMNVKDFKIMKKLVLTVALILIAALGMAQADLRRAEGLSDSDWNRINEYPEYFKEILAVQDSLMVGQTVSVSHLQSLMPRTYDEFLIFINMEYYAVTTSEGGIFQVEDDKGVWSVAANYAKADTLDMMSLYLMWFEWCDGWIAEDVWTEAVEIERRNPQKFKKLMASSKWYEDWQVFREEYIKWEQTGKD